MASTPGRADQPVVFYWNSGASALHGEIMTTLPSGEQFRGEFLEITSTTSVEDASLFYDSWYEGWTVGWDSYWWDGGYGWADGYAPGVVSYITNYSGLVLATLTSPRATTMRCRFFLNEPEAGLAGGGQGDCKTSDGAAIDSVILSPAQ